MEQYGESDIRELALHDAHVHRLYTAYRNGWCSWENMLLHLVVVLARENQVLRDKLTKCISLMPPFTSLD